MTDPEADNPLDFTSPVPPSAELPSQRAARGRKMLLIGGGVLGSLALLGILCVALWPANPDSWELIEFTNKAGGRASLHYTKRSKKDDAERLGTFLREKDMFGGRAGADVVFDDQGGQRVISFFMDRPPSRDMWDDYRELRDQLTSQLFKGGSVKIQLCKSTVMTRTGKVLFDVMATIE
jgi:hypothetical protein